jgi:hypothetical protein
MELGADGDGIGDVMAEKQRSWDMGTEAMPSTNVMSSTEATSIEYDRVSLCYQCLTICIMLNINK